MEAGRREPGGNRPAFHGSENGVRHARETQGRGNAASRGRLDGRRSASAGQIPCRRGRRSRACCRPPRPPSRPARSCPPPPAPGAEVPNRPVHVTQCRVEGVTAYPQPEIAQLAAGLVGPAVPLPKIDAARQAILQTLPRPTATCSPPSRPISTPRQAALRRHRGAHRQRQAGRRHRPGWHAGAALPQPPDREAADRFGHAGALPAAGAGRARRQPAGGAGALGR